MAKLCFPIISVILIASRGQMAKTTEGGDATDTQVVYVSGEDGETVGQTSKTEAVSPSVVETSGVQVESYVADSEQSSNVEGGDSSDNDSPDGEQAENIEGGDGDQSSKMESENTVSDSSDNRGDRGFGKKLKKPLRIMAKGAWKGALMSLAQ